MLNLKAPHIRQCERCHAIKNIDEFSPVITNEYFSREYREDTEIKDWFWNEYHSKIPKDKTIKDIVREFKESKLYKIEQVTTLLCNDCIDVL